LVHATMPTWTELSLSVRLQKELNCWTVVEQSKLCDFLHKRNL
jgi:hypothetical protein